MVWTSFAHQNWNALQTWDQVFTVAVVHHQLAPKIASDWFVHHLLHVAHTTGVTSGWHTAVTTSVTSYWHIALTTSVTSGWHIAVTTRVTSGWHIAVTTSVTSYWHIALTTSVTSYWHCCHYKCYFLLTLLSLQVLLPADILLSLTCYFLLTYCCHYKCYFLLT